MLVVEVVAHAKLNLGLTVLGRRPDGFHDLESFTVSINEPHDVLTCSVLPAGRGVRFVAGGDVSGVPSDDDNLVVAAARHLVAAGIPNRSDGIDVELALHKRIPVGAGLGGGSADAAATLVGLRRLLEVDVDDAELERMGAELGSDVAFCVRGGAAMMRGRGDRLEPTAVPALRVLVAIPPIHCSTPAVYTEWDRLGGPSGREVEAPPGWAGLTRFANDLEPAAWSLHPALASFKDLVEDECARPAIMAGSGSAYVVCFRDDETPGRAVAAVRERTGATVFSATVTERGCVLRP